MAAVTAKKGKKKKGRTIDINTFLSGGSKDAPDGKAVVVLKQASSSWADAIDDDEDYYAPTEQIALPTAPRAAREEIDFSQLPDKPPYTAYVGNLSYDVDEDVLSEYFTKLKLSVDNVRLPRENGRMKGYGYVEFVDKQTLVDALKNDGEMLMQRKIKVDLATSNRDGGGFGGDRDRDGRGGNQISGEGDADEDWRGSAAANKAATYDSSSYGGNSRDGGGFNRGRDDRDGGGFGSSSDRFGGISEADSAGSWGRGPPRSTATGYEDRNGSSGPRRDDRDSGFGGPRRGYDDRDSRYGGSRQDRDIEYGSKRGDSDYGAPRRGYDDSYGRRDGAPSRSDGYDRQSSSEAPKERPRIQLQPRTKPVEEGSTATPSKTSTAGSSSVFGDAKPVDTAAKEREIEERLMKREQESRLPSRDTRDSFSSRDIRTDVDRKVYNASDSDRSVRSNREEEEEEQRPVEKPAAPEPVKKPSAASIFGQAKPVDTAAREREIEERLRKERENDTEGGADRRYDNGSDRRYEGGSDRRYEGGSDRRYEGGSDRRYEGGSERRYEGGSERRYEGGSDRRYEGGSDRRYEGNSERRYEGNSERRYEGNSERRYEGGSERRYEVRDQDDRSRDAPQSSAWGRGPPSQHQNSRPGVDSDKGQGGRPSHREKRERPLPTSIDEMPVYKDSETKDFSDKNKYAGLQGSDDDGERVDE